MKKILILALLSSFFSLTPIVFADETQYAIREVWMELPHEGCCPTWTEAYAVNDNGYVVGRFSEDNGQFGTPFWWHDGAFLPITNPPSDQFKPGDTWGTLGMSGAAIDINNANQFISFGVGPLIGTPTGAPTREGRGFYFDNGTGALIHDFMPLSIDSTGTVYGSPQPFIGASGEVIEHATDTTWKDGAFITPSTNPEIDTRIEASGLTDLKLKLAPGFDPLWGDLTPADMNIWGQIVGTGKYGLGDEALNRAFILTPITVTPEPTSMALFGLGAGALALARRRKKASRV